MQVQNGQLDDNLIENSAELEKPLLDGSEDERPPEQEQADLEKQLGVMEQKSLEFREKAFAIDALPRSINVQDQIDLSSIPYSSFQCGIENNEQLNSSQTVASPDGRRKRLRDLNSQLAEKSEDVDRSAVLKEKHALLVAQSYIDTFYMKKYIIGDINRKIAEYRSLESGSVGDARVANKTAQNKDDLRQFIRPYIELAQTAELYFDSTVIKSVKKFESMFGDDAQNYLKSANEVLGKATGGHKREVGLIQSDEEQHHSLESIIGQFGLSSLPRSLADFDAWLDQLESKVPETITDTTPPSDPVLDEQGVEGEVAAA